MPVPEKLADIMKPLKRAEQMACVCHIEPNGRLIDHEYRIGLGFDGAAVSHRSAYVMKEPRIAR